MAVVSKQHITDLAIAYVEEDASTIHTAVFRKDWGDEKTFVLMCDHGVGGIKKYVLPLATLMQFEKDGVTAAHLAAADRKLENIKGLLKRAQAEGWESISDAQIRKAVEADTKQH